MPTGKRDEYLAKTHPKKRLDEWHIKKAAGQAKRDDIPDRGTTGGLADAPWFQEHPDRKIMRLGKEHNEKYNPKIVSKVTAAVKRKKDAAKLMEHAAEYAPSVEKKAAGGRIDGCAKRGKTRGKFV